MSRRTERIASLIRTILAEAIQNRLSDPRIEPLTSITRVDVSADLAAARVHVSVMADQTRQKLSIAALQHAAGRLRSLLAREMTLRHVPQLSFLLDESLQRGSETVQQLDRIMEELDGQTDPGAGSEAGEPDSGASPAGGQARQDGRTGGVLEGQEDD